MSYIFKQIHFFRSTLSTMDTERLSQPHRITKVVCGPECTFVILENGELYACGDNAFNRLGIGKDRNMAMTLVNIYLRM